MLGAKTEASTHRVLVALLLGALVHQVLSIIQPQSGSAPAWLLALEHIEGPRPLFAVFKTAIQQQQ
jgi:hypothetical protein